MVSREQMLGCGMSRHVLDRLLSTDRWRRLQRGIYLTVPALPDWPSLAWAGLLLGGDQARLGPQASGYLHGLRTQPPSPIDVLVPDGSRTAGDDRWRFVGERAPARSARCVGSPPRLPVATTVLDLCAAASEGDVVGLVTTAVQRRLTTTERLAHELGERSRHRHRTLLAGLLADVEAGAESSLEVAYLRDVERRHGLPRGRRQGRRFGLPYVSDVGYDEYALLVELDGRAGHQGVGRFRDMRRDNQFALVSWLTLRYGWFDVVERPCSVAAQVASVLRSRGWAGTPGRCSRCSMDLLT